MAPASASPQPPSGRSDVARRGGQGSNGSSGRGGGRHEQAEEQHEVYGPLCIERHVKEDGRALILYAWREHEDE